jgi:catalase
VTNTQPPPTTTDAGIPAESDEHSLTVGPDGPVLMQDHYLIEQMAQFNRERVDKDIGDRIEQGVRAKASEKDPKAEEQGNPARSAAQAKA